MIDTDQVLKQSSNPYDYKDQCPTFKCNDLEHERNSYTLYLDQQIYCYKSDFASPLDVYLKDCKQEDKYCSGSLNRCMADPYKKQGSRLPGNLCEFNRECLSNNCEEGRCVSLSGERDG